MTISYTQIYLKPIVFIDKAHENNCLDLYQIQKLHVTWSPWDYHLCFIHGPNTMDL